MSEKIRCLTDLIVETSQKEGSKSLKPIFVLMADSLSEVFDRIEKLEDENKRLRETVDQAIGAKRAPEPPAMGGKSGFSLG